MNLIYHTGVISLVIQIITWFVDIYVLSLKFDPALSFLRSLLWIEFFVQIVEGIFYIWLVSKFSTISNITIYRYYDWIFTTPTMLFTYCMYLYYINKENSNEKKQGESQKSFFETVSENTPVLVPIFVLNTLMLFFGYLVELKRLPAISGAVLGFLPFFMFFYLIYDNYAKYSSVGRITFWYFSGIWGLYGIASVLSYKYKNVFYNILDLFSKNFFGIFLAVVLLMQR